MSTTATRTDIPVLEIGGTHITTALVDPGTWSVRTGSLTRSPVHPKSDADALLDEFAAAANGLASRHSGEFGSQWAVAIPGPFDYEQGVGRYIGVDKFEALTGRDVRGGLLARIRPRPSEVRFINDADAFGLGEAIGGAARGYSRSVCLTLGTGVGSAYVVDGIPVQEGPGVPPEASAHLIEFNGQPLEETMSRRALRSAYALATGAGEPQLDVHEIVEAARTGDAAAAAVLESGLSGLGRAMSHSISEFGAEILVLGGSMTGSWDIVEPAVRRGLATADPALLDLAIARAAHPEDAPLIGAAAWATRAR